MLLKVAKLLWYLSLPVFLGLAIYIYIYLPDNITLAEGISTSKSSFFYLLVGVMLLINFAFGLISNLIGYFPKILLFVPKKSEWTASLSARKKLARQMNRWFKGLLLMFNAFLIVFGGSIYTLNNPDTIVNVQPYFYVVMVFVVVWLLYYPFAFKNAPESE